MSNTFKDIDIKSCIYYFFNDRTNILINTDEKSYKNIFIYYIGYVTIKDLRYVKNNSVNPL